MSQASGALEHAIIEGGGDTVTFTLNPTSLQIRRMAQWTPSPNRSGLGAKPFLNSLTTKAGQRVLPHGPQQFTGGQPATLTMKVWFDDTFEEIPQIVKDLATLNKWCCPPEQKTGGSHNPETLTFSWGKLHFVGHIQSLNTTIKLFSSDGDPVRAEVSLTMTEDPPPTGSQNPSSGGLVGRRVRMLAAGDSLQSIAAEELGSPFAWRTLAEANCIDDPLRVAAGTALLIPPPGHVAR